MAVVSYKDPVTGLLDDHFFRARLKPTLAQMVAQRRWGALLLVELTNRQALLEQYGANLVDRVLARLAETLRYGVRINDQVGRYGDARFAVLLKDGMQPLASVNLAKRQLAALSGHQRFGARLLRAEIAIGIRVIAPESASPETLMAQAEWALAGAKAAGGRYRLYSEEEYRGEEEYRAFDIEAVQANGRLPG